MARSTPPQVPGAESAAAAQPNTPPNVASMTEDEKDALIAKLQAENEVQAKQLALPQVVYEPKTPKGEAAIAASSVAHMSVDAVRTAIQAGDLDPPTTSYLCANGWYARNDQDIPRRAAA